MHTSRRTGPAHVDPGPPARRRRRWVVGVLWLSLALVIGSTAAAVIPACGVALPWGDRRLDFCRPPPPAVAAVPPALDALLIRQRLLEEQLQQVRLRLASAPPCPAAEPEVAALDPPSTAPRPLPAIPVPPTVPERQALPATPDPPAAAPPEDDRLRIPDDIGRTGDLGFLAGCWRTDPFRHWRIQPSPGISTYCFDANGRGSLTFRRDRLVCEAPARVEVLPGGRLRIWDADTTCNDGSDWYQDRLDCTAAGDGVARCSGESSFNNRWTVNLHRV